jgi:uncharacterized membrane protein YciS (DUF1049 family)
MFIEAHEEFVQHIEAGQRRIRSLSVVTLVVALLLSASYVVQIIYPFALGQSAVTVNLTDPTLLALEFVFLFLTVAWIIVGLGNYRFATRLGRMVKEARAAERELERKLEPLSR